MRGEGVVEGRVWTGERKGVEWLGESGVGERE